MCNINNLSWVLCIFGKRYSKVILQTRSEQGYFQFDVWQVGMETEGFAIYDTMMNVKNEVLSPVLFALLHSPLSCFFFIPNHLQI